MTKKDYLAIAQAIADHVENSLITEKPNERAILIRAAHGIANYCERENPSGFNRELFLINCGINDRIIKERTK